MELSWQCSSWWNSHKLVFLATTVGKIWKSNLWTKQVLFRKNFHYWGSSKDCQWHKNWKTIAVFTNKIIRSGILITRIISLTNQRKEQKTHLFILDTLRCLLNSLIIFIHPLFFSVVAISLRTTALGRPKRGSFSLPPRWLSSPEVAPHRRDDAQHAKVTWPAAGRGLRLRPGGAGYRNGIVTQVGCGP